VRENRERKIEEEQSDLIRLMKAWDYARSRDYNLDECRRLGIHAVSARHAERAWAYFLGIAEEQGLAGRATIAEGQSEAGLRSGEAGPTPQEAPAFVALRKCILLGFSDQLARQAGANSTRYLVVHGRTGTLAKESIVRGSPFLVASEIRELEAGKGNLSVVLSLCTAVEQDWLRELFPGDFSEARTIAYDDTAKRVTAQQGTYFRDLLIEARQGLPPRPEEAAPLLAAEVLKGRIALKHWDHAVEQWIARVNLLARQCPELNVPAIDEQARRDIVEHVCVGPLSAKDLKEAPVWPAVKAWLSAHQQAQLNEHAPERLRLPNGRTPAVKYAQDAPPFIALRIQELYGVTGEVRIALGRVPVLIHVLAPNQRPVQITADLAGFWKNDYPRVKRELQRKYPKHEWR